MYQNMKGSYHERSKSEIGDGLEQDDRFFMGKPVPAKSLFDSSNEDRKS